MDCSLKFDAEIGSLIFESKDSIRSLEIHLGNKKIKENLWRGSRDGFKADDFHLRCNDKGKTLTVVKTTRGTVLGGYTDISWS